MGQLRLAAVLAAADLAALGDVLCHRTDGLAFLLQALVAAPALVQASASRPHCEAAMPANKALAASFAQRRVDGHASVAGSSMCASGPVGRQSR